jgi:hypothetical protein
VDGLVFRIARDTCAREGIARAAAAAEGRGLRAQVHVRLADDSPAQAQYDEWRNTCRVLETALCSHFHRDHRVFLDTLGDVDRGYFPRAGLIDRRGNPRLPGRTLRNLNGALSELPPLRVLDWHETADGLLGEARAGDAVLLLPLPETSDRAWQGPMPSLPDHYRGYRVDLGTGAQTAVEGDTGRPIRCEAGEPALWVLHPAP